VWKVSQLYDSFAGLIEQLSRRNYWVMVPIIALNLGTFIMTLAYVPLFLSAAKEKIRELGLM
jgi:hypothetical protein